MIKNPHAVALGSKGGHARKKNLTKEQLREIAMKGVEARRKKAVENTIVSSPESSKIKGVGL